MATVRKRLFGAQTLGIHLQSGGHRTPLQNLIIVPCPFYFLSAIWLIKCWIALDWIFWKKANENTCFTSPLLAISPLLNLELIHSLSLGYATTPDSSFMSHNDHAVAHPNRLLFTINTGLHLTVIWDASATFIWKTINNKQPTLHTNTGLLLKHCMNIILY